MKIRCIIIFLLVLGGHLNGFSQFGDAQAVSGNSYVCPRSTETYAIPYAELAQNEDCLWYANWKVTGGTFLDGTTTKGGANLTSIAVNWGSGRNMSIEFTAQNNIAPDSDPLSLCARQAITISGQEDIFDASGVEGLVIGLFDDENWFFISEETSGSGICETTLIATVVGRGNGLSSPLERKMEYAIDDGSGPGNYQVIYDWTITPDPVPVDFNTIVTNSPIKVLFRGSIKEPCTGNTLTVTRSIDLLPKFDISFESFEVAPCDDVNSSSILLKDNKGNVDDLAVSILKIFPEGVEGYLESAKREFVLDYPTNQAPFLGSIDPGYNFTDTLVNITTDTFRISNLSPGIYRIDLDNVYKGGCVSQFFIKVPERPCVSSLAINHIIEGSIDSYFNATMTGGEGRLTTQLVNSNGVSFNSDLNGNQDFSAFGAQLPKGIYTLTLTDGLNNSSVTSIPIYDKRFTITTTTTTNTSCSGTGGAISVNVSANDSNYNPEVAYQWMKDNVILDQQTSSSISDLAGGSYTIQVTRSDDTYSKELTSAPIQLYEALSVVPDLSNSVTDLYCDVDRGEIILDISGGNNPTISWTGTDGYTASTGTISNLTAGTYTVNVSSNYSAPGVTGNCTGYNGTFNVTKYDLGVNEREVSRPLCADTEGTIQLSLINADPSRKYKIVSGTNKSGNNTFESNPTLDLEGRPNTRFDYTVEVEDENTCNITGTANMPTKRSTVRFSNIWAYKPDCRNGSGSLKVEVMGKVGVLTKIELYEVNDPNDILIADPNFSNPATVEGKTQITFSDLTVGKRYYVRLKDDNCTITSSSEVIPNKEELQVKSITYDTNTYSETQNESTLICHGTSTSITLELSNTDFRAPYNVVIKDASDASGATVQNITETSSNFVVIPALPAGSYTAEATGTTGDVNNVVSCPLTNPYSFTVVEAYGPLVFDPDITGAVEIYTALDGNVYHVTDHNKGDGAIAFQVSGGKPPYTSVNLYKSTSADAIDSKSNVTANTKVQFNNLAGKDTDGNTIVYRIEVIDALGCDEEQTNITLNEPDLLQLNFTPNTYNSDPTINIACNGGQDYITVSAEGGVGGYEFELLNADESTTSVALASTAEELLTSRLLNVEAGEYIIKLTDKIGVTNGVGNVIQSAPFQIKAPEPLEVDITSIQPSCEYNDDGRYTVSPSGGIALADGTYKITFYTKEGDTYIELNSDEATSLTLEAGDGTYYYTVQDGLDCFYEVGIDKYIRFEIIDIPPLSIAITADEFSPCAGDNTATLSALVQNGTKADDQGYTVELYKKNNDAQATEDSYELLETQETNIDGTIKFEGLFGEETYRLVAIDENICETATIDYLLADRVPGLSMVVVPESSLCATTSEGKLNITSFGGDTDHIYSIDNWVTSQKGVQVAGATEYTYTYEGLASGSTHEVLLRDKSHRDNSYNNVCEISEVATITETPQLTLKVTTTDIVCAGDNNGSITLAPEYGAFTDPSEFNMNVYNMLGDLISEDTAVINGLSAGQYLVVISNKVPDRCDKPLTRTVAIVAKPALVASILEVSDYNCSSQDPIVIKGYLEGYISADAYTYAIDNGGFNPINFNDGRFRIEAPLTIGNHRLSLKDVNGCIADVPFDVDYRQPIIELVENRAVDCFGTSNGLLSFTSNMGDLNYELIRKADNETRTSSGQSVAVFDYLAAGDYRVSASDGGCISVSYDFSVGTVNELTADIATQTASCGVADGSLSYTLSGGAAPYETYVTSRSGGLVFESTALSAGDYKLVVTDANDCQKTFDFEITERNVLAAEVTDFTKASCGKENGAITIVVENAIRPLRVEWYNEAGQFVGAGESIAGLGAGNYNYTISDQSSCSLRGGFNLEAYQALAVSILALNPATPGIANGRVTIAVSGYVGDYTVNWIEAADIQLSNDLLTAQGLLGGNTYTVKVSDELCNKTLKITVPNTVGPSFELAVNEPVCGQSNGSLSVINLSGIGAISYDWIGENNQTATLDNIAAGEYTVKVTDDRGSSVQNITLSDDLSNLLSISVSKEDESCLRNDGSITLSIAGGQSPFQVSWENLAASTATLSNLAAGEYKATVSDSRGCSVEKTVTIKAFNSSNLTVADFKQPDCGNASGHISLSSLGEDYQYVWSHDELLTSSMAEDLSSGRYKVYAYNTKGCITDTLTFYLADQGNTIAIQTSAILSASCNSSQDGEIEVNVQGNSGPYSYEWDDPLSQATARATGLAPGIYTVKVTDALSCSAYKSVTLGTINPVYIVNIQAEAPSCSDAADGSLTVNAGSGSGNYTYEWSNGATSQTINGLVAGDYTVTVMDKGICTDSVTVSLLAPAPLSVTSQVRAPICIGDSNGTATIDVSGGKAPYEVNWIDGFIGNRRFDLKSGEQLFSVTDAKGCNAEFSVIIPEKDSVTLEATIKNALCYGSTNGSIEISNIEHAVSPLLIWSNGQIGKRLLNVGAGTYSLSITDIVGCISTFEYTVGEPSPLALSTEEVKNVLCFGERNGSITLQATGGSGSNYNYRWKDGYTTNERKNLSAGTYEVVISDANGCSMEKSYTLTTPEEITWSVEQKLTSCFGSSDGEASVTINGGTAPYVVSWSDGVESAERTDLSSGRYEITITDSLGCSKADRITILSPSRIQIDSVIKSVPSCYQANDGSIGVTIKGGSSNYTYLWSNGATTASLNDVSAGSYQLLVKDEKGCEEEFKFVLDDAEQVYLKSLVVSNPICYGEASGSVQLAPDGGTSPYTAIWEDGTVSLNRNDLTAGTHSFIVQDGKGCESTYEVTLTDPALEQLSDLPTTIYLCEGGVTVVDAGDWDTYQWTADNGYSSTDRRATIDASGNYTIDVTNNAGCIDSHEFEVIKDDDLLQADFLLTTEAVVGDTVLIIDISWPMPDSVRWINPDDNDFYLVNQTIEYQEVIFTRTGDFELAMKANLDLCEAYVEKTITVISREEAARLAEEKARSANNALHLSTNIYPNPNHGVFRLEVEGSQEHDVRVRIVDLHKGNEYYQMKGNNQLKHVFNVQNSSMHPGVYIAIIEADDQIITKRFVIK